MSSDAKYYELSKRIPSRKSIPPFESLRAFDAVARLGGIRKAAHALLRNHAVVSRHLKAVEEWTGCALIDRTPGGVVLTEEGQIYHLQITQALDLISESTIALMKRCSDDSLQVWCMSGFALHWMARHLRAFENANPGVHLELRSTGEEPDFSRHEADVNIRLYRANEKSSSLPPGMKSQRIAKPHIIPVASPEFLADCGDIRVPEDLLKHQLLREDSFGNWQHWFQENDVDDVDELDGVKLWDGHMTLAAARHGRGIALTNNLIAVNDIASGRLVEIGADNDLFKPVSLGSYHFIARADRWDVPSISRFRNWLVSTLQSEFKD
ncbi:glycine cleavage system transcriptional activator [Arenicella chitinivorans]|uniref:Glycine cleavage system transcriptional activator n=1 Tax=Arenicella chitinivorans TaxID=1329800 RepID=A0A918RH58_9GAMM|nr:LysR substrate-binding domain-containing protein [Arenicella chitinivorans]GGZ97850.1 glycine cleavage system transcriptional activator [Arenicella chitinivorans]